MILAAGVGSRLRPLTDSVPKALVEVGGIPLLENVIGRLRAAGVTEIIINTHHHAEHISGFLKSRNNFGIRIETSHEPELLDTGGGLKQAAWFFDDGKPFFLHNADVLTTIDLPALVREHEAGGNLATLAVSERKSSRHLLFDANGLLCGHETPEGINWSGGTARADAVTCAFNVVHVISPALLPRITESGAFSIITPYLRIAGEGGRIGKADVSAYDWFDIGTPESLARARAYAAGKNLKGKKETS